MVKNTEESWAKVAHITHPKNTNTEQQQRTMNANKNTQLTLMSQMVQVVSMEHVPMIEGSVSFQSKLVNGAQYSAKWKREKNNIRSRSQ